MPIRTRDASDAYRVAPSDSAWLALADSDRPRWRQQSYEVVRPHRASMHPKPARVSNRWSSSPLLVNRRRGAPWIYTVSLYSHIASAMDVCQRHSGTSRVHNGPESACRGRVRAHSCGEAASTRTSRKPYRAIPRLVLQTRRYKKWCGWSFEQVKTVEIVKPAEDVGRDTLSRYDMQFQAAAYAALQILEGQGVDCVYCDFHDDFVVRRVAQGKTSYHFFQVKTKQKLNHQWSLNEVFSIKARGQQADHQSLARIRESFGGKLLLHGIVFDEACTEATLLSNVYFADDVVEAVEQLRGKVPTSKAAAFLSSNFSAIFSIAPPIGDEKTSELLSKLSLRPSVSYIDKDRDAFANAARSAIYEYSEIDLTYYETKELANGLVDLVFRKSKVPLAGVAPAELAARTGVGLDDLLEVLSISRAAYEALLKGTEPKALKQASAIQRWLKNAKADDRMVEFASQKKVDWDLWLRTGRHNYSPLDLNQLLERIDQLYDAWAQSGAGFAALNQLLEALATEPFLSRFNELDRELLFGAVASVVVKVYSR
jgi:hypothetical protein